MISIGLESIVRGIPQCVVVEAFCLSTKDRNCFNNVVDTRYGWYVICMITFLLQCLSFRQRHHSRCGLVEPMLDKQRIPITGSTRVHQ